MYSFSIEHLDLSQNNINDRGGIEFAKHFANNYSILTLNLRQNQLKQDFGLIMRNSVAMHRRIQKIWLEANSISIRDIEEINRIAKRNKEKAAKG